MIYQSRAITLGFFSLYVQPGFAKLKLGFSRGGTAKASCGWVLAAVVRFCQAVAGWLLTPAEAGCKLVGHPAQSG